MPARIAREHETVDETDRRLAPPSAFALAERVPPCALCGSTKVRLAANQPTGLIDRLIRRRKYRCVDCRGGFVFVQWRRALLDALLVLLLLGGIAGSIWAAARAKPRVPPPSAPLTR